MREELLSSDKTRVLSYASHHMKAPLNRILGLIQLINFSKEKLDDEHKEYLNKIHLVASDGLDIINTVINAYNLEIGEFQENKEPIDIFSLIKSRIDNYRDIAKIKYIDIKLTAVDNRQPTQVLICKLLMNCVIDNMLSNAIKFTPEKKKIHIHIENRSKSIVFSVRDEGPGISSEQRKQLYKKFHQLSAHPTVGETTTGLGLYVTKTILDKINGEIQCESTLREGTQFTVTIHKKPSPPPKENKSCIPPPSSMD